MKKVLVSGCFDLLHAGHVAFFKEASSYGELYVGVGNDKNVQYLKGRATLFSQEERRYIVQSIRYVKEAFITSGMGMLDFEPDIERVRPDVFVVNSDGHSDDKELLCKKYNIKYIVLERIPEKGLPARSSSSIKKEQRFPFRICIAGGWVDQPWISEIYPGSVVVARLSPTNDFNERSGMATSSRKVAIDLWHGRVPPGDPIKNARLLFGAENPPGSKYISGSQDHIGLLASGINRLDYNGDYWPFNIESTIDEDVCNWLSNNLHLICLKPRQESYDPLVEMNLNKEWIRILGESGLLCWNSILNKDINGLGRAMTRSFEMWQMILPNTIPCWVKKEAENYNKYPGLITSGSGGGYLVIASEEEVPGAIKIRISK